MMMLNISSLTERRNSEPKTELSDERARNTVRKIPSPLEKTMTYLTTDDDNSDTESLSRYARATKVYKKNNFLRFSVLTY